MAISGCEEFVDVNIHPPKESNTPFVEVIYNSVFGWTITIDNRTKVEQTPNDNLHILVINNLKLFENDSLVFEIMEDVKTDELDITYNPRSGFYYKIEIDVMGYETIVSEEVYFQHPILLDNYIFTGDSGYLRWLSTMEEVALVVRFIYDGHYRNDRYNYDYDLVPFTCDINQYCTAVSDNFNQRDTMQIHCITISKELESYVKDQWYNHLITDQSFQDPKPMYSNLSNGFGIFTFEAMSPIYTYIWPQ